MTLHGQRLARRPGTPRASPVCRPASSARPRQGDPLGSPASRAARWERRPPRAAVTARAPAARRPGALRSARDRACLGRRNSASGPWSRHLAEQLERLADGRRPGARRAERRKRTIWQRESTVAGTDRVPGRISISTVRGGRLLQRLEERLRATRPSCARRRRGRTPCDGAMRGAARPARCSSRMAPIRMRAGALGVGLGRRGHDHVQVGVLRRHEPSRAGTAAGGARTRPRPRTAARCAKASAAAVRPLPAGPTNAYAWATRPVSSARRRSAPPAAGRPAPRASPDLKSPRRCSSTTPIDLAPRPRWDRRGLDQPDPLGLGAMDLEVAAAHAAMERELLALEVIELAGPRCAGSPPRAVRSNSSVRSGHEPSGGAHVELADQVDDRRRGRSPGTRASRRRSGRTARHGPGASHGPIFSVTCWRRAAMKRNVSASGSGVTLGPLEEPADHGAERGAVGLPRQLHPLPAPQVRGRDAAICVVLPAPSTPSNVMRIPRTASSGESVRHSSTWGPRRSAHGVGPRRLAPSPLRRLASDLQTVVREDGLRTSSTLAVGVFADACWHVPSGDRRGGPTGRRRESVRARPRQERGRAGRAGSSTPFRTRPGVPPTRAATLSQVVAAPTQRHETRGARPDDARDRLGRSPGRRGPDG